MISRAQYILLFVLLGLTYLVGMFVTLFENDSAQFAVMAMRMVQEHDFINLIKGQEEYLDKPHMHYWLAALSYLLFGITDWAYRIPALLATALAAYSCYGLGKLLYRKEAGRLAALIFLSSQTIVLAGIDVRTDAVLTGFAAFAIWQLAVYIEERKLAPLLLGALGAGLAFSTKGQIALLVIALPLLCHLAYSGKWKVLLDWRLLPGLLVFALAISPMLYAYYLQFDMHPEKVIRGRPGRSGLLFIFWEQSFERLSGEGVGKNSSDYFFFFHTFLWVFLPWTVAGIAACISQAKQLLRGRERPSPLPEALTLGGILLIFIIVSFAQFKLPHYLNITIPLFAVLTSGYLFRIYNSDHQKAARVLRGVQYAILAAVFLLSILLCFVVFRLQPWYLYAFVFLTAAGLIILLLRRKGPFAKIVLAGALASVVLNLVLNLHFYPSLLEYQGGSVMARVVKEYKIPREKIYKLSAMHTWALDFYNREPVKITTLGELSRKRDVWLYATETEVEQLREKGLEWEEEYTVDQFRITRLQFRFLNPETRGGILENMHLIHFP